MERINYCTNCGYSVKDMQIDDGKVSCSCMAILDAYTGKILSKPIMNIDYDPGDYPEGYNAELYSL